MELENNYNRAVSIYYSLLVFTDTLYSLNPLSLSTLRLQGYLKSLDYQKYLKFSFKTRKVYARGLKLGT